MGEVVPFHSGFWLGRFVDAKSLQPLLVSTDELTGSTSSKINKTTHQCSILVTLEDVYGILGISPEYVLKVKSERIKNDVVEACLKGLGEEHSFTIIVRSCHVQQRQSHRLQDDAVSRSSSLSHDSRGDGDEHRQGHSATESVPADALADVETGQASSSPRNITARLKGTHWVEVVEYGNELIIVIRLYTDENHAEPSDLEPLRKLKQEAQENLPVHLQDSKAILKALKKTVTYIDKKLRTKKYGQIHLDIKYGYFEELDRYPATLPGMVKTVESFMGQCVSWEESDRNGENWRERERVMMCRDGIEKEDLAFTPRSTQATRDESAEERDDKSLDEDFEMLDPLVFYTLRVTLQPLTGDLVPCQNSEITKMFESLYSALLGYEKAEKKLQTLLDSEHPCLERVKVDVEEKLKQIKTGRRRLAEAVDNLDFICKPSEETLAEGLCSSPLEIIEAYIKNVTTCLPPGGSLDLLMIGKTGHGKSAVGNSILGTDKFVTSANGESETRISESEWTEIDGRVIKVVDTPGVCDTRLNTDFEQQEQAIQSVSNAIASCPKGFNALLLVFSLASRMTKEELEAIGLLKRVMGEDIIKSHCICVITYGDNFEREMEKKGKNYSFKIWCREQTDKMESLFKECNYRCVLFNNITTDATAKKSQLIQLVAEVDSLQDSGARFTPECFDIAQRVLTDSEKRTPQINENLVREIKLILSYLDMMAISTPTGRESGNEMARLQGKVDNLMSMLQNIINLDPDNEQLNSLLNKIHDLARYLHARNPETTGRSELENPANTDIGGARANVGSGAGNTDMRAEIPDSQRDFEWYRDGLETIYENVIYEPLKEATREATDAVEGYVRRKRCFPGSSTVVMASGKCITLEELQIGDTVLVRDSDGHLVFDTVYMFGHWEAEANEEFIVFTAAQHQVFVTQGHYVYCTRNGEELCIASEYVRIGDCLLIASTEGFVPQPVENITYQRMRGLFAPFTHSGTIVVDNALMSCYIDVLKPTTCHTLMWPVRQLARISPRALAFINGSPVQHPVPLWVNAALKLM